MAPLLGAELLALPSENRVTLLRTRQREAAVHWP